MPTSTWLLFLTTVFFVSATPGPNMLLAMHHGIRYGLRGALPTCMGLLSALFLIMLASAAGLGALLAASSTLFAVIKWLGALYLIWLGIRTWRAPPSSLAETGDTAGIPLGTARFRTGFLVAMSNPKAFIFFGALFPQFMDPHLPQAPQLAILAASFFVIETSWQFVYAAGGARLTGWLSRPGRQRLVNRLSGSAFAGAGLLLAGSTRL